MNKIRIIIFLLLIFFSLNCTNSNNREDINSEKKLIFNATILTMNNKMEILEDAYILIENNLIVEIGTGDIPDIDAYEIDAQDQILLPGFINTHTHIPMTIFRGLSDDKPLDEWLNNYIWPAEKKFLNERNVALGTQLGLIEMIKSGTVCFNDNYFFADIIARETEKVGLRAVISETILDFPTNSYNNIDEAFILTENFISNWHEHNYIHPAICCHSVYACDKENLLRAKEIAAKYNLPINIHISETSFEVDESMEKNGKSPVEYLYDLGFFQEKVFAAHCVWLNDKDIEILQNNNVSISHNPTSNLKLSSGIAPIPYYLKKGLLVSLGTDGAASNNNLDMLEEARLAAILHKGTSMDPETMDANTVLKMLTIDGARAIGLDEITGSIEKGKRADMILIDKNSPENIPSYDYYSTLVYSTNSSSVNTVIVDGNVIMLDKEIKTIDESIVYSQVRELKKQIRR